MPFILSFVSKDDAEMIRVRLPGDLHERWRAVLEGRKISQQRALVAAIEFLCEQEALTQAMIFQQVPDTDHPVLSQIVLEKLAAGRRRKR